MRVQSGGVQRCRHLVGHAAEDPTTRRFPVHRWRWERTQKRSVGRTRSPRPLAQTAPVATDLRVALAALAFVLLLARSAMAVWQRFETRQRSPRLGRKPSVRGQ